MIAPLIAFGGAVDGPGTRARLVLRHDGVAHEVIAVPDGDPNLPGRPVFSSASTVWAGTVARSDDAGVAWQRAASLPPLDGSLVALLVERSPSGSDVATIAMSAERWETLDGSVLAPLVFRSELGETDDVEWKPVPGIDATRFPTLTILRTRSGRTEMLRQLRAGSSFVGVPPDGAVRVDAIDHGGVTPTLVLDDGFVASDYATSGGTGWIVGMRRDANRANGGRAALVRFADDGAPFVPGDRESIAEWPIAIRFFDDSTGIAVTAGAIFATTDGGETWARAALPNGFRPTALAISPAGR